MNKLLTFYPANKKPIIDCQHKTVLPYNPCDGYHLAEWICFSLNDFTPSKVSDLVIISTLCGLILPDLKNNN